MAQPLIQTAFHAGELAPNLFARVDLAKFHSAAALMNNFFVDYRGGASTRPGTRYLLQCYKSNKAVRLIPFQASFTTNYVLEFGDFYIRFYVNGGPVLENATTISGATQANPCVLTITAHPYNTGDWIFISGVVGMTQLNGKYFQVTNLTANTISLQDLNGNNINSSAFTAYVSGGSAQRVYTITSPYAAADLALLKYAQNVNTLVLCHSSYAPYVLTIISTANWTLTPIVFGATIFSPSGLSSSTTFTSGSVNYSYEVTSVDSAGQESQPTSATTLSSKQDESTTRGTNQISWTAQTGAQYYNVYKAKTSVTTAIPAGAAYGFIGFTSGVAFNDVNIQPDFSSTPPIANNPFSGAPVASATITTTGTYTTVPTCSFAAPASGPAATGQPFLGYISLTFNAVGSLGFAPGDRINYADGVVLVVDTVNGSGSVLSFKPLGYPGTSNGFINSGSTPSNPMSYISTSGGGHGALTISPTWGVQGITMTSGGGGYVSAPSITFSAGAAAATAVLGPASSNNPSVPAYFQQRLVLAGPVSSPQTFFMSKPGLFYNFDISNPTQDDDSIEGTINSLQLNTIKAMLPMTGGLITLCDKQVFLINGGGQNVPITPADASADSQSYNGCSDIPPIVAVDNLLYVQAKGSIIRELNFNFYSNTYRGPDISILSSHLFFGYSIVSWAYAEEPFKVIWAVRSDGILLSLTYLKEQELAGWAHSNTSGLFKSVACITETVTQGTVDATYFVIQRTVNGNTVQYVERMADRFWTLTTDPWCVDAGLNYNGAPASTLSGLDHLVGQTVTGIADGVSFGTKVVSASGTITLSAPASNVTVGLAFTPQLGTLPLDAGEPTIQGKPKKITAVTVRCTTALGLNIGSSLSNQLPMKDTIIGNVGRQTNTVLSGLFSGDAWTAIDPLWQVPGQYVITQPNPYPATILGVIPEFDVGNTFK